MKYHLNKKGFTLIELLVVVAIIGILAAVGVVAYSGYVSSAKATVNKRNHNLIVKQVKLIIANCDINGNVEMMSDYKSKVKKNQVCYGNVQSFFPSHFLNHMNNQMDWVNQSSNSRWNGKDTFVLQEGNMSDTFLGFVFLQVPSNSNRSVIVNIFTCIKSPCNDRNNRLESYIKFDQW